MKTQQFIGREAGLLQIVFHGSSKLLQKSRIPQFFLYVYREPFVVWDHRPPPEEILVDRKRINTGLTLQAHHLAMQ